VDTADEGDLVATVCKKRRGNAAAAHFEVSIGDGQYISLSDPMEIQKLDDDVKLSAISQLQVMQDHVASLMQHLTTKERK
jgi:hypothetical protein